MDPRVCRRKANRRERGVSSGAVEAKIRDVFKISTRPIFVDAPKSPAQWEFI